MTWAKSKLWANVRRIGSPACPNCNASLLEAASKKSIAKVMPIDNLVMSDAPLDHDDSHNRVPAVTRNPSSGGQVVPVNNNMLLAGRDDLNDSH